MKKWSAIITLTAISLMALAGCGKSATKSAAKGSSNASTRSARIVAVGSTALQPLVEQAAKQYAAANKGVNITVQGGGSGAGLSQVATKSVTIGNSDIFAQQQTGIPAKKLVDHQVAVAGIAPIVNEDTGVKNVTQKQLVAIFQGKITNWKQVGGKDEAIVLINRATGSGTRRTFDDLGLKTTKIKTTQEQDSNGTVFQMVHTTPGAISYVAFSYLKDGVTALSIDGVTPTVKHVITNRWKIWAYEHMYTNGAPDAATAKFINYIQAQSQQKGLVTKMGYIPVSSMRVARTAEGKEETVGL